MAFSRFKTSTLAQGLPKYQDIYDGVTVLGGTKGYAYVAGGYDGSTRRNEIQKFDMNLTTIATIAATLDQAYYYGSGVSNSNVAGYVMSPEPSTPPGVNYSNKLTYSTDARTNTGTGLTQHGGNRTGMSNSGTAGYSSGGYNSGNLAQISKVLFSNDANSTLGATLDAARREIVQGGDKNNAGYVFGGYTSSWTNVGQKLTFSTEARTTIGATLPTNGGQVPSVVDTATAMYIMGDQDASTYGNRILKFTFSGESMSTLGGTLATKRNAHAAGQSKSFAGFTMGGIIPGGTYTTSIEKFDFATSTVSAVTATLSYGNNSPSSFSNELSI